MDSTIINSTTPTEFFSFSTLPVELRQMVWNEALPILDIQRFTVEIAYHPDSPHSDEAGNLVLCLTPHEDFVQLTKGHLGLLGACYESRMAAIAKIPCNLPINYIALDGDGGPVVRFARVPFNPDGQLCISGLGVASFNASCGRGARGMDLRTSDLPQYLAAEIQCVTIPEIKNLTIALDPPMVYVRLSRFMRNFNKPIVDNLAMRMDKLQTVALIDEGVLNERHGICPNDFDWLHKRAPVVRPSDDDDGWNYEFDEQSIVGIPWLKLYEKLKFSMGSYFLRKQEVLSSRERR